MEFGPEMLADVEELSRRLGEILKGNSSDVVGAALADVVAIWLSGHHVLDHPAESAKLRREILQHHNDCVTELLELYESRED